MSTDRPAEGEVSARLRRGALGLAGIGVAGTAAELAFLRHWNGFEQLIPWIALAALAIAGIVLVAAPTAPVVRSVRLIGGVAAVAGLYGVYVHVSENYATAPLDGTYGPRWDSMSFLDRVWAATTGEVGPAPTLAPGALAQIGLCLLLACTGHPALRTRRLTGVEQPPTPSRR